MDELMHVEMLNKDNILFDEKFNDLKKFYIFDDERSLRFHQDSSWNHFTFK